MFDKQEEHFALHADNPSQHQDQGWNQDILYEG
jgi:hypothetical protein